MRSRNFFEKASDLGSQIPEGRSNLIKSIKENETSRRKSEEKKKRWSKTEISRAKWIAIFFKIFFLWMAGKSVIFCTVTIKLAQPHIKTFLYPGPKLQGTFYTKWKIFRFNSLSNPTQSSSDYLLSKYSALKLNFASKTIQIPRITRSTQTPTEKIFKNFKINQKPAQD